MQLEELLTKLQHLNDKRKEEAVKKEDTEEEKVMRGVQGSESSRGDGEEVFKPLEGSEKKGDTIRTRREAGVGEEHLQGGKVEPCDKENQTKRRGEAEGGQKEREIKDKDSERKQEQTVMTTSSEIPKHCLENNKEITSIHQALCLSGPDLELLTHRLQEAQEEADHQARLAQDLRSKLGEQSKKTWEAEQKLVLVEAELQRLKKAAESLVDARRQIEVWTDDK